MSFLDYLSPEWWRDELQDRGWEIRKAKLAEHYYALFLEQVCHIASYPFFMVAPVLLAALRMAPDDLWPSPTRTLDRSRRWCLSLSC